MTSIQKFTEVEKRLGAGDGERHVKLGKNFLPILRIQLKNWVSLITL